MKKFITQDGNLRYQSIKHLLTVVNELHTTVNKIAYECGVKDAESPILQKPKKIYALNDLINIINKHFGFKVNIKSRKQEVAEARFAGYYILQKYTRLSLKEIGEALGNKDHSTVNRGIIRFREIYQENELYKAIVDNIITEIETEIQ